MLQPRKHNRNLEKQLQDRQSLAALLEGLGGTAHPDKGWGHLLEEIFELVAEPKLIQPTFVFDYPKAISPLAKESRKGNSDLVERFELFIAGMEIANAFSELNDPIEQRKRFEKQVKLLRIFVTFYKEALNSIRNGVSINDIRSMEIISQILRAKFEIKNNELDKLNKLENQIMQDFKNITKINKESEGN